MEKALSFDDVLIEPGFSDIDSRKDVDLSVDLNGLSLKLPVISSPMDTVTTFKMAQTLNKHGGIASLHRFQTIEEQVQEFKESDCSPIVSVGLNDWERIDALSNVGGTYFLLDVAHGAQESVVRFVYDFRKKYNKDNYWLMVGNFSSSRQVLTFIDRVADRHYVNAWRLGIGGGSACSTRIKTGCGVPTMQTLLSLRNCGLATVADGGIKTSGDAAKALTASNAIMVGRMLAGTEETPTFLSNDNRKVKLYRGSASAESYAIQNKVQSYITPEGETYEIPFNGTASKVLRDLEGGIRSAMTYVGARNLYDFRKKAHLVEVTLSGHIESGAHGKKL
jgi:IMP dehydrogenase